MRADLRANLATLLPVAAAMAAALLTAGGCSMAPRGPWLARPAVMDTQPPAVARLESKAIDDGVGLVGERRYAEAEMTFRRAEVWFRAGGDKGHAAECLFWIGFCQEKQGLAVEARVQYDKLIHDYPGTAAARQAAERMRRMPAPAPPKGN